MPEAITFSGYQIRGADVTRFDLILGYFAFRKELESPGKGFSLVHCKFPQCRTEKKEFGNNFILSWRLSKASKEMIYQRNKIVACIL